MIWSCPPPNNFRRGAILQLDHLLSVQMDAYLHCVEQLSLFFPDTCEVAERPRNSRTSDVGLLSTNMMFTAVELENQWPCA